MKFSGSVGFWEKDVETKPGVYQSCIIEKPYTGDVYRFGRKWDSAGNEQQNDNFNISNQISILSDLYMRENWPSIKYVKWNGVKWKVGNVNIDYPRITMDIGGIYHGKEPVKSPSATS